MSCGITLCSVITNKERPLTRRIFQELDAVSKELYYYYYGHFIPGDWDGD